MNETNLDLAIEQKLDELEKRMDDSFNGDIPNYIQLRYYMLFFVIGGDNTFNSALERRVRALTRSRHVFQILPLHEDTNIPDTLAKIFRQAADKMVNVQDLNTIMIAPVIVSKNVNRADIGPMLQSIVDYCGKAKRTMQWQPFIILEREVKYYPDDLYCLERMKTFMEQRVTVQNSLEVNRCCLLSRKDENGFSIAQETILQTIAMTAVLQNAIPDDKKENHILATIRYNPAKDGMDNSFFVTVRSASVASPVRSTMLVRMQCATALFSDSEKKQTPLLQSTALSIRVSDLLDRYLRTMPGTGLNISLMPLCGVMSGERYRERLEKTGYRYYREPLERGFSESTNELRRRFFSTYFSTGGRLSKLREVCQRGEFNSDSATVTVANDVLENIMPQLTYEEQGILRYYFSGYHQCLTTSAGEWCRGLRQILNRKEQLSVIKHICDSLEKIQVNVLDRLERLNKTEVVLEVGLTEVANSAYAVQAGRMQELQGEFDPLFDEIICKMLMDGDIANRIGDLLDTCYAAAATEIMSDGEFMGLLSEECSCDTSKVGVHKGVIDRKMKFPVNLVKAQKEKASTFIIGNQEYAFFRQLADLYDGVNCLNFQNMDRIEILQLSSPFLETELQEWSVMNGGGTYGG